MKVFLCWSGNRSKRIAEALNDWLPLVINAVEPWMSPSIDKGVRWGPKIAEELEESKVGIICLTKENLNENWVLFEAGALSKTKDAHVCTFLLGLKSTDIKDPLAQFQYTQFNKEDFRKLIHTINKKVEEAGERSLNERILNRAFNTNWPSLEKELQGILEQQLRTDQPIKGDRELLFQELQEIKRQNNELASLLMEFRHVLAVPSTNEPKKEIPDLSGTWVDVAFDDEIKYADCVQGYLIFTYEEFWPGVYFGKIQGNIFSFVWTRFDESLGGKGYLELNEIEKSLVGGLWFDDTDIESMLARDKLIERHKLVRKSTQIDNQGRQLLEKAKQFLIEKGLIKFT